MLPRDFAGGQQLISMGFSARLVACPAGNQGETVHILPFSLCTSRSMGPVVSQVLRTPFVSDTALAMYYFLKQRLQVVFFIIIIL